VAELGRVARLARRPPGRRVGARTGRSGDASAEFSGKRERGPLTQVTVCRVNFEAKQVTWGMTLLLQHYSLDGSVPGFVLLAAESFEFDDWAVGLDRHLGRKARQRFAGPG
jgi:hypothetical protein